ncbi:MAG: hypothetical protein LBK60_08890 [Verrucomicrobiales bacterium]|nr:hypothetical protein [Verrucomicrobiales bacterium]
MTENTSNISAKFNISFDVGHSSLGWAVLDVRNSPDAADGDAANWPEVVGCGVVTFRPDDCLASARREFRRQRRHIRSTRQRIARMKTLLISRGILSKTDLDKPGCAWPWLLAARVLDGKKILSWPELWDVLRWYAHNRGYDGNKRWSGTAADNADAKQDAEKEKTAKTLMAEHGTDSMAETFCKVLKMDADGERKSSRVRFKGLNAAFPRKTVEDEVVNILAAHIGKLPGCDEHLVALLVTNSLTASYRAALSAAGIRLSANYEGGLLFGQLVPRFDNRIIAKCPVNGQNVPARNCAEFLNFRWAMLLANIRVAADGKQALRALSTSERMAVDAKMRETGHLLPSELKKIVCEVSGATRDNLAMMLMHPDAKEALALDFVQKEISSVPLKNVWNTLPLTVRKHIRTNLRRGKKLTLAALRTTLTVSEVEKFDAALRNPILPQKNSRGKKSAPPAVEDLLNKPLAVNKLSGRAAYSREVMKKAFDEVMAGKHPTEEGGCLYVTEKMREAQLQRSLAEQTNNHLVRHRLLILERLQRDIIKEYADGDAARIGKVTIEVNRDLREMSGKTAKEKAQDLGLRLANFKGVVKKLESDESFMNLLRQRQGGSAKIPVGIIRKARIAEDLSWQCPYTGQDFEPVHLLTRDVDKDHVVPRSQRASDSLSSLVVTFATVNKWKGKRTALKFIEDEQGKSVPGMSNVQIMTKTRYVESVKKLEAFKGHDDDKRRKKKRKELLQLADYDEPEFTPRDLTQTSQLVRLGAQMLKRQYQRLDEKPPVVSVPGSVTGALRKGWNKNLLGCLTNACSQVKAADGGLKTKTEIRDITHLHHALDACVLGLATRLIPNKGDVWKLLVKHKLNDMEKAKLRALGIFDFAADGEFKLRDLPPELEKQIRKRLKEKRVVQHIPARMSGLRVEQNTWRVVGAPGADGEVELRQRIRQADDSRLLKKSREKTGKLLGMKKGKLCALKGALVVPENFGVALDPMPVIIPWQKVWPRLEKIKADNGGKMPRVLRNGMLVKVTAGNFAGTWKIFSVKNNATGMAVDMGWADVVKLQNKVAGHKINVRLATLLKDGLTICKTPLTGISSCPTISST